MKEGMEYKAWVTADKGGWYNCDNWNEFDWDNRMRKVGAMYFPLGSYSGKDISLEEIECEGEDNYASGWIALDECILMPWVGLRDAKDVKFFVGDIAVFDNGHGPGGLGFTSAPGRVRRCLHASRGNHCS